MVATGGRHRRKRHFGRFSFSEVARPHNGVDRAAIEGELDGRIGQGGCTEVLQGHLRFKGGVATLSGKALDGRDAHIRGHYRNGALTFQQGSTLHFQGVPHAHFLPLSKGLHTRVIGVVHKILGQRFRTINRAASDGSCGGRGVAHAVALGCAIGFFPAAVCAIEGVVQSEVVPDLMGQGAVEVEIGQQIIGLTDAEHLVMHHNAIVLSRGWREVSKTEGGGPAVQSIKHPDVDVFCARPVAQCFDVHLRGRVSVVVGDHARCRKTGNDIGHIGPRDARRRIAFRVSSSQLEFDVDVSPAIGAAEISIQRIDGALNLGFRNVGTVSCPLTIVHDVNDHGQHVVITRPLRAAVHLRKGGFKGKKAAGKSRVFHHGRLQFG